MKKTKNTNGKCACRVDTYWQGGTPITVRRPGSVPCIHYS